MRDADYLAGLVLATTDKVIYDTYKTAMRFITQLDDRFNFTYELYRSAVDDVIVTTAAFTFDELEQGLDTILAGDVLLAIIAK